jgi:hypothetical protein
MKKFTKDLAIPISFFNVSYNGSKFPGSKELRGLKQGANCQYFVYELMRYFGYKIKDFRSSELWEDTIDTK